MGASELSGKTEKMIGVWHPGFTVSVETRIRFGANYIEQIVTGNPLND